MKHLHLVVPTGLSWLELAEHAGKAAPSLLKLLARGVTETPAGNAEASLAAACCRAFGVAKQQDWPMAAITARIDGLMANRTERNYWLRIDPVHLEIGMGGLLMHDPASLNLSENEVEALTASLNRHSGDLAIHYRHPARWHLCLPTPPALATTPLDRLSGAYLSGHLPRGEDAGHFMRLINHAQMLLHDHPVNLAREHANQPVVNGLWLWGGGHLPILVHKFDRVAANQPEAQVLAALAGCPSAPCPSHLKAAGSAGDRVLIVLPDPLPQLAPAEHLRQLEPAWFQPLLRQLQLGRIGRLDLDLLTEPARRVTLGSPHAWRFWRAPGVASARH